MSPKKARYLELQKRHLKQDVKNNFGWVSTGEFLMSMRQIGYTNTFKALAEFIDNSIEAFATNIVVVLKTVKGDHLYKVSHPGAIAVYDNGQGMEPDMIRASLRWGGTHRYEDRSGFGRFGIGLPGAAGSLSTIPVLCLARRKLRMHASVSARITWSLMSQTRPSASPVKA